jgi:2-polyprenyl-6-methoxyphenol hydroxylase-like FAD-dependent oxidoreductase
LEEFAELEEIATSVCIVGAGPAGAMLGLLFARAGIRVVLLEKHMIFFAISVATRSSRAL